MLATTIAFAVTVAPGQMVRAPCATPQLMRLPKPTFVAYPTQKQDGKAARDAYAVPKTLLSDNLTLRWGNDVFVDPYDAQHMLDAFELSWQAEITDMGHPPPVGSDHYLFNVYIGSTGSGAPPSYGSGGYFYYDDDGWPMIVVSLDSLGDADGFGETLAAHELYHAVQDATGRFAYDGVAAWFHEATAEWMSGEVFPNSSYWGSLIFGYAFLPHYPLDFFDYPASGALEEYHQYGAFIFPRFLTEQVADWRLIRDTWLAPGRDPDPLLVLDGLLGRQGIELEDAFIEFAAHNATWDYQHGQKLEEWIEYAEYSFPGQNQHIAADAEPTGTDGWVDGPADVAPQRFGYNIIRVQSPAFGTWTVALDADPRGTRGSTADWRAGVVRELLGGREYVELPLAGAAGEATVPGVAGDEVLYLVVAAVPPSAYGGETFGYRYQLSVVEDPGPGPDPTTPGRMPYNSQRSDDGGCAAVPNGEAWLLAIPLAVAFRRRRRG